MKRRVEWAVILLSLSCIAWSYSAARKNSLGEDFYRKGEYEKAIEKFSQAMTEAPEKPELYFNIGDALYKQSKFPEAITLYEKSAAPGDASVQGKSYYNIGNSKYRTWKEGAETQPLVEAAACYVRALEMDPNDMEAKYNLEFVLKKMQEQKQKQEQQEKKEQEKGQGEEEQEKGQEQKEKEQKEQEKKEQEKSEQEKKEQKEQEKKEQEKKEEARQEEQQQGEKGEQPETQPAAMAQAEQKEEAGKELTGEQAAELVESFEREQRDPVSFIRAQIQPEPRTVDKDW